MDSEVGFGFSAKFYDKFYDNNLICKLHLSESKIFLLLN